MTSTTNTTLNNYWATTVDPKVAKAHAAADKEVKKHMAKANELSAKYQSTSQELARLEVEIQNGIEDDGAFEQKALLESLLATLNSGWKFARDRFDAAKGARTALEGHLALAAGDMLTESLEVPVTFCVALPSEEEVKASQRPCVFVTESFSNKISYDNSDARSAQLDIHLYGDKGYQLPSVRGLIEILTKGDGWSISAHQSTRTEDGKAAKLVVEKGHPRAPRNPNGEQLPTEAAAAAAKGHVAGVIQNAQITAAMNAAASEGAPVSEYNRYLYRMVSGQMIKRAYKSVDLSRTNVEVTNTTREGNIVRLDLRVSFRAKGNHRDISRLMEAVQNTTLPTHRLGGAALHSRAFVDELVSVTANSGTVGDSAEAVFVYGAHTIYTEASK